MSMLNGSVAEAKLSAVRREVGAGGLVAFLRAYLPHYFKAAPSLMHAEIAAELERLAGQGGDRGSRLAVAAPRGHAKSTLVTLGFVLWCAVYRHEAFMVIISDTADQAKDMLSHVKTELETNELLRADFPDACEQPGVRAAASRWRKDDIVTRHGVRVRALGAGQGFRGARYRAERPTLIVLDDAENEDDVRSEELRAQRLDWFKSTVSKSGTGTTNIVAVGTVLHTDSLLAHLLDPRKSPGWRALRYKALIRWPDRLDLWQRWEAVYNLTEEFEGASGPRAAREFYARHRAAMDAGAEVLWPAADPLEALMTLRTRDGAASFEREKQNEPAGMENTLFREIDLHYWDIDQGPAGAAPGAGAVGDSGGNPGGELVFASSAEELERLLRAKGCRVVLGVDPSLGIQGRDYTGLVVLAKRYQSELKYVLHAEMLRCRVDETIEHILQLCRTFDIREIAFEGVHFQAVMADNLRRRLDESRLRGVYVRDVKQTAPKLARFQSLQPDVAAGRLRFSRRQQALITQLLQVPNGTHDDGVDALEIAVRGANKPVARAVRTMGGVLP